MSRDSVEYEFDLPDGSVRHEIVDLTSEQSVMSQCQALARLHGATGFRPLSMSKRVEVVPMGGEFYVYQGEKLLRVCPSIGMANEVAAGARA